MIDSKFCHRCCAISILILASLSNPVSSFAHSDDGVSSSILAEYRQKVRLLEQKHQNVIVNGISRLDREITGKSLPPSLRLVRYLRLGSSRLVSSVPSPTNTSDPYLETVGCIRDDESFLVQRFSKDAPFQLKYLGQDQEPLASLFETLDLEMSRVGATLFSMPISRIISLPDFKLIKTEESELDHNMLKMTVSFKHPSVPDLRYDGSLVVDRGHEWVLKSYEFQGAVGEGFRDVLTGTLDYVVTSDGLLCPKRIESMIKFSRGTQKTTMLIEKYERADPRSREFSLAEYGLAALEKTPTSWSIWSSTSVFLISIFCLGLAILLKFLASISSAKGRGR